MPTQRNKNGRPLVDRRTYWSDDHKRYLWRIAWYVYDRMGKPPTYDPEDLVQVGWYDVARKYKPEDVWQCGKYVANRMFLYAKHNQPQSGAYEPSAKQQPEIEAEPPLYGYFLAEELVAMAWQIENPWKRRVFLAWCMNDGDTRKAGDKCGICTERVRQIVKECKSIVSAAG